MKIDIQEIVLYNKISLVNNVPIAALFKWSHYDSTKAEPVTASYQITNFVQNNGTYTCKLDKASNPIIDVVSDMASKLEVSIIATQDQKVISKIFEVLKNTVFTTLTAGGAAFPLAILEIFTDKIAIPDKQLLLLGDCVFDNLIPGVKRDETQELKLSRGYDLKASGNLLNRHTNPHVLAAGTVNGSISMSFDKTIILPRGIAAGYK